MKKKTTVLRYCINTEREKYIVAHTKEITRVYHTRSLHSSSVSQLEEFSGCLLDTCGKVHALKPHAVMGTFTFCGYRGKTPPKYFSGSKRCAF